MWQAGAPLHCGSWASHCGGFSSRAARALGLQSSVAVAHGPSYSAACRILLDQESNQVTCIYRQILNHWTKEVLKSFNSAKSWEGLPWWFNSKESPAVQEIQEMQVQSLGQEDPLEKEITIHSSILASGLSWWLRR